MYILPVKSFVPNLHLSPSLACRLAHTAIAAQIQPWSMGFICALTLLHRENKNLSISATQLLKFCKSQQGQENWLLSRKKNVVPVFPLLTF